VRRQHDLERADLLSTIAADAATLHRITGPLRARDRHASSEGSR